MVIKYLTNTKVGKEGTKQILKEVDRLILNKKTKKNPSQLLKEKKTVTVGDNEIPVGRSETTDIRVKDFKVKEPKVSKETIDEFLKSFQNDTIPKNILRDFNIDKISKNEDVIKMINGIAKGFKGSEITKQTRGVKSNKATKASGTRLSKDEDFLVEVLGTKPGQTYNAAQIYAIRQMLEAGAARMTYLAKKATSPDTATQVDILKFRQHYALMAQIQKVLMGVKTETGRALQQFKIASDASKKFSFLGGSVDDLNRKSLIVELGGADEITKVAELVLSTPTQRQVLKANNQTGLVSFSKKVSDSIAESFINVILSNPLTHIRNGAGNWISQALVAQERKLAARLFGGKEEGGVAAYEDIAKAWGKHMAAKEIMAQMKNVYKLGGSKVETKLGATTAQTYNIKNKALGNSVDMLGKIITLNNLPTKFLKVSDDFFKNREFRSELYALAFRDMMEMNSKGLLRREDMATYMASKIANPDKQMIDAAYKQAQYVTFQTPLKERSDVFRLGKAAQDFKSGAGNVGPFSFIMNYYLPFVQTPTNIAGFVAERTPILAQVLTRYNSKIAQGGAVAQQAKAQLYLGSMFYMATAPLGYYGVVKGSDIRGDATQKLSGGKSLLQKTTKTQPMQIELPIGNGKTQKISFRSFDPVAQIFANSANFGQMLSLMQGSLYNNVLDADENNYNQLTQDMLAFMIGYTFSIGENLSNSTMLAGAGQLIDDSRKIIRGVQSENKLKAAKEITSEFASSFIPTAVKEGGKLFNDEHQKITTEFNEYFKKNIAESDLEYDYDMRGRKYDKFRYFSQFERDAIDEELYSVFPKVTPVKNTIQYNYSPELGLGVSVPLNSSEKRFLRKNAGLLFDQKMKVLMEQPYYKNETRRFIKAGLIQNEWKDAKSQAKEFLLDPNQGFYEKQNEDGVTERVSFLSDIEQRAIELRDNELANSQLGYRNDNINDNN